MSDALPPFFSRCQSKPFGCDMEAVEQGLYSMLRVCDQGTVVSKQEVAYDGCLKLCRGKQAPDVKQITIHATGNWNAFFAVLKCYSEQQGKENDEQQTRQDAALLGAIGDNNSGPHLLMEGSDYSDKILQDSRFSTMPPRKQICQPNRRPLLNQRKWHKVHAVAHGTSLGVVSL